MKDKTAQTVSLEVAKQLKEAGYNTWTSAVYRVLADGNHHLVGNLNKDDTSVLPAPVLHDILDELPNIIELSFLTLRKDTMGNYAVEYPNFNYDGHTYPPLGFIDNNAHDAAARLWLWAVNEGYITLNQ